MNFHKILNEKCFEPVKRNKDGWRHVGHRFPIKGGISLREVMLIGFRDQNVLLREFSTGGYKVGETLRIRLPGAA